MKEIDDSIDNVMVEKNILLSLLSWKTSGELLTDQMNSKTFWPLLGNAVLFAFLFFIKFTVLGLTGKW